MYKRFFKRLIDLCIVLCAIICLSPLFLLLILLLYFANRNRGAGVFFTQERPGKDEKIFKVVKFKSMTDERDANGNLLPDAQRLTKVGRFIRSTSLDELPQLFNVLRGDMALVGPRPLLPRYLPYYTDRERLRHTVRPGITGWAQANGRNFLTWDQKLEMDAWYVEHLTLWLDIKILFLTIKNVLKRDGVAVPKGVFLDNERMHNKKHLLDKLIIRPLERRDLAERVSWMKNPKVYRTMNLDPNITIESTLTWYENNQERKDRVDFVVEDKDGQIVAFSGITGISDSVGETYSFVSPDEQGKGYGTIARYLTCKYAFDRLLLKKIVSYCNNDNIASIKVNDCLGYKFIKKLDCMNITGEKVEKRYYELTRETFINL